MMPAVMDRCRRATAQHIRSDSKRACPGTKPVSDTQPLQCSGRWRAMFLEVGRYRRSESRGGKRISAGVRSTVCDVVALAWAWMQEQVHSTPPCCRVMANYQAASERDFFHDCCANSTSVASHVTITTARVGIRKQSS